MKVICHLCGTVYLDSEENLKKWAESGEDFDPTDWTCPSCTAVMGQLDAENEVKNEAEMAKEA